ncbi:MAG TPA: cytochrome c oxidase subunit II [Candidatus Eisenbacteria bacterium]|nr:cytochrome c oxidase subunit II [Candidatus Eisenbacteria bacterium]
MLPQASDYAARVDALFLAVTGVCVAFGVPVMVLLATFCIRFRRGRRVNRRGVTRHTLPWEITWTAVPTLIAIGMFVRAAGLYASLTRPPEDALEIAVTCKQWMWKFQHPTGPREIDALHVPAGRAVRLTMTSEDVIHSLYVPALRIKQDVLPGRYTELWFRATRPGSYALRCAEYCGVAHSRMDGIVVVLPPEGYAQWLRAGGAGPDSTLAARGAVLFRRFGCSGCHRDDGRGAGPSLLGVAGHDVPLAGGRFVRADDGYLRDAILLPARDVVAGYAPVMPSFAGQIGEDELFVLLAYLHALGRAAAPDAAPPATLGPGASGAAAGTP